MSYDKLDDVPTQSEGTSEVLASDWNLYVRDNFDALKFGHLVYANASARNSDIASPVVGIMTFLSSEAGQEVLQVFGAGGWRAAVNSASIVDSAVTEAKIASNAVTNAKLADNAVNTSEIVNGAVTYAKLGNSVKAYNIATSPSVGSYYASNGSFAPDSLSTGVANVYLVISDPAANAGAITLTLDDAYLGAYAVTGQTITVLQKTAGITNIVAASGTTINGNNNNYVMGSQYSVVTLIRIGAAAWVIAGDYI